MGRLQHIYSELTRRRVFRALLSWGVVSFAVLQVVEPVMHGLDLPPWTLKVAIWTLAAGFPVTSVLAWTFDLSLAGVRRTPEVPTVNGARSLQRLGRGAESRATLENQFLRWRDADPDLPLLEEMKALCKEIDCRPAQVLPRK